jgi:hypothetical protein
VRKTLIAILLALALVVIPVSSALAATDADVQVTAKPGKISISVAPTSYTFNDVTIDSTPSTAENFFAVTNKCGVESDNTIMVVNPTWTGGATAWTHADDGNAGDDIVALLANQDGTWGTGDVIVTTGGADLALDIVKKADWNFGLMMLAPSDISDFGDKVNTVRITAAESTMPGPG